jgi:hypothetical protein
LTVPTRRARDYYLRLGYEETATYLKKKLGTDAAPTGGAAGGQRGGASGAPTGRET